MCHREQKEAKMGFRSRVIAGAVIMVSLAVCLGGQAVAAKIFGTVSDEDGNKLSGVEVTVTNIDRNAEAAATTGKKGTFRFLALPPGAYQVSFDLEGYQSYVAAGVRLYAEQSVTLRVKLKKKNEPEPSA
jgi:hypothetical protein